jgi:hypothetical protein
VHGWGAAEPWEQIAGVVLIDVSAPGPMLAPLMEALLASRTEAEQTPVIIGMTTMPKGYYPQMPEGVQAMLYKSFPFRLLCSLLADFLDNQE